jgi:hypothetical protein
VFLSTHLSFYVPNKHSFPSVCTVHTFLFPFDRPGTPLTLLNILFPLFELCNFFLLKRVSLKSCRKSEFNFALEYEILSDTYACSAYCVVKQCR